MKSYLVNGRDGLESLSLTDADEPRCGPGEVVVELRAASLNYRDLGILRGGYVRNDTNPVVPLSDGAGVVVEVGTDAGGWSIGDRVTLSFVQDWVDGSPTDSVLRSSLGGGINGVLRERMTVPAHGLVRTNESLSDAEASCLPCAAVTAWQALIEHRPLKPTDTVLLLGTGGVSMFALQIAASHSATVIQTSSSETKLKLAREHGATHTINYREVPEWSDRVLELTDGRGVDFVVEVGGPGTLGQSLRSIAVGGQISLIGVLDDPKGAVNPLPAMFNVASVQGIYVGSRAMLQDVMEHLVASDRKPIIDRWFAFDDAPAALEYFKSQQHVGKVVIEFPK